MLGVSFGNRTHRIDPSQTSPPASLTRRAIERLHFNCVDEVSHIVNRRLNAERAIDYISLRNRFSVAADII